jgi:hypothetical protein
MTVHSETAPLARNTGFRCGKMNPSEPEAGIREVEPDSSLGNAEVFRSSRPAPCKLQRGIDNRSFFPPRQMGEPGLQTQESVSRL